MGLEEVAYGRGILRGVSHAVNDKGSIGWMLEEFDAERAVSRLMPRRPVAIFGSLGDWVITAGPEDDVLLLLS